MRLERIQEAFERYGVKHAHGYALIKAGLFPAPIGENMRPSRVPAAEVDELIRAVIAGADDDEVRKLVTYQAQRRKARRWTI